VLENQDVDEWIILIYVTKNPSNRMHTGFVMRTLCTVMGSCEHSNESPSLIEGEKFR
jgi:hypothetical protein